MLKILSSTFLVLGLLLVIVFGSGIRKGPEINVEIEVFLGFSQEYIFDIVTEIEMYPERKRGLDNIEILERQGSLIVAWRENYSGGDWKEMRILEKNPSRYFVYEIYDSKTGYTSEIAYWLEEEDAFTKIYISEKGKIENRFRRGLRFLSGDDSFLKKEGKWIRVAIQRELIERE
jgi:hypothetical protein